MRAEPEAAEPARREPGPLVPAVVELAAQEQVRLPVELSELVACRRPASYLHRSECPSASREVHRPDWQELVGLPVASFVLVAHRWRSCPH